MSILATRVSEKTMNELSRLTAQYSDVNATKEDVEMYLDRIARSKPKSSVADKMSNSEWSDYLQQLREKKQANQPEEE
jgi:hypothetical protein